MQDDPRLTAHLFGELSDEARDEVEALLDDDPASASTLAELVAITALLEEAFAEEQAIAQERDSADSGGAAEGGSADSGGSAERGSADSGGSAERGRRAARKVTALPIAPRRARRAGWRSGTVWALAAAAALVLAIVVALGALDPAGMAPVSREGDPPGEPPPPEHPDEPAPATAEELAPPEELASDESPAEPAAPAHAPTGPQPADTETGVARAPARPARPALEDERPSADAPTDIALADPVDSPGGTAEPAEPAEGPVETLPEPLRRRRDERRMQMEILDAWTD